MTPHDNIHAIISESQVGLILFILSLAYCISIVIFDSKKIKRRSSPRTCYGTFWMTLRWLQVRRSRLLLSTPWYSRLLASNSVYVTITSLSAFSVLC